MTTHILASFAGPDYQGSAADTCDLIAQAGATSITNIEASSVAGHFRVSALIEVEHFATFSEIASKLLADKNPHFVEIVPEEEPLPSGSGCYALEFIGFDRDGHVRKPLQVVRASGAHVLSMRGVRTEIPMDGTPLFIFEVRFAAPADFAIRDFCEQVELCANEQKLDWDLRPAGDEHEADAESAVPAPILPESPNRLTHYLSEN